MDVQLYNPEFDSNLTGHIMDLDHLRKRVLTGTTEPLIFFQLKDIFHMMESIGSANIEGNRTTVLEYVENKISEKNKSDNFKEIENIENTMDFIEEKIESINIDHSFIREFIN